MAVGGEVVTGVAFAREEERGGNLAVSAGVAASEVANAERGGVDDGGEECVFDGIVGFPDGVTGGLLPLGEPGGVGEGVFEAGRAEQHPEAGQESEKVAAREGRTCGEVAHDLPTITADGVGHWLS